jgi:hypothetical protein
MYVEKFSVLFTISTKQNNSRNMRTCGGELIHTDRWRSINDTGMCRITTFRSTTNRIYNDGPIRL